MGINCKTTLESGAEEFLVDTFCKISPSDFMKSKILVASFKDFLGRCTKEDFCELIPQTYKAILVDTPRSNVLPRVPSLDVAASNLLDGTLSSRAPSPFTTPELCPALEDTPPSIAQVATENTLASSAFITPAQPTADTSLSTSGVDITKDLVAITKCNDPTRITRLVQTIQALKAAPELPLESYERLWSTKGALFDSGTDGWICRLQRGRRRIDRGSCEHHCAARLSLMLMAYTVDYTSQCNDLELKSGWGRKSAAFDKVARDCKTDVKTLKCDTKRARNYFHLLNQAGPGSLLETGDVTSVWESSLTIQDIDDVLQYRKIRLPKLEMRAISLNGVAARTIRAGLVACGWPPEALLKPTQLMDGIRNYLDIPNPPNSNMRAQNGVSTVQQSRASINNLYWSSKKRCRDIFDTTGADHEKRHRSSIGDSVGTNPSNIFNEFGQPHITETSTANARSNNSIDAWMADTSGRCFDLPSNLPRPGRSTGSWLPTNYPEPSQGGFASMDVSMLNSLDRASWLPNTLGSDLSLSNMLDPRLPISDTAILESLGGVGWLPSTPVLDSSLQNMMDPSLPISDTAILESLGRASWLPSAPGSDSSQVLTINPSLLLSDTTMLNSLGRACYLPGQYNTNTENALPGVGQLQDEISAHVEILI